MFKANDLIKYGKAFYIVLKPWDNDAGYLHVKTVRSGMHGTLDAELAILVGRNYKGKG